MEEKASIRFSVAVPNTIGLTFEFRRAWRPQCAMFCAEICARPTNFTHAHTHTYSYIIMQGFSACRRGGIDSFSKVVVCVCVLATVRTPENGARKDKRLNQRCRCTLSNAKKYVYIVYAKVNVYTQYTRKHRPRINKEIW